jgi:hypothetical protein
VLSADHRVRLPSLSGIWTAGPFAAAAPPLASGLVDLFTALLKASDCDIEVQGFGRTSGRVKPVHDHVLPHDVREVVDTAGGGVSRG